MQRLTKVCVWVMHREARDYRGELAVGSHQGRGRDGGLGKAAFIADTAKGAGGGKGQDWEDEVLPTPQLHALVSPFQSTY